MTKAVSKHQTITMSESFGHDLGQKLSEFGVTNYLLVCGQSFFRLGRNKVLDEMSVSYTPFTGFSANPTYNEVEKGIACLRDGDFDAIVACGGGSAIDVAKCIRGFAGLDAGKNYLTQTIQPIELPLIAIPTTAGTGSESTSFAVVYYKGEKQSVDHESLLPEHAILAPELLESLPAYQKSCTLLDALCQAIESWWSVNSSDQSIAYSKEAVAKIIRFHNDYLKGVCRDAARQIMLASNYAGRAINLTKTTAPHAMSYKLTSLYGIPHGHAVALCLPEVWDYMIANMQSCIDQRGQSHLQEVINDIAFVLNAASPSEAIANFRKLLSTYELKKPQMQNAAELQELVDSVNLSRLSNNPVAIDKAGLKSIYQNVLLMGGISKDEG